MLSVPVNPVTISPEDKYVWYQGSHNWAPITGATVSRPWKVTFGRGCVPQQDIQVCPENAILKASPVSIGVASAVLQSRKQPRSKRRQRETFIVILP
jgi:hypothetical protein